MYIRPELQALRGDDTPQRLAQARQNALIADWRAGPIMANVEAELAHFAAGTPLDELSLLSDLFTAGEGAARRLVDELIGLVSAGLSADPLGQVPLRHFTDDFITSLMLARCGDAALSLEAIDGAVLARRAAPASASFSPSETHEYVLAGSAEIERVRIASLRPGGANLAFETVQLGEGDVSYRSGASEALVLRRAPRSLVTLKLQRRAGMGAVTREYRLSDGELLHQAAGNPHDSRLELTTALLGRMERKDAAPLLAAMAEETGSQSLRWQALRECLGLDAAAGFAALCKLATRANDPLAAPAGALRAQLIEKYPQLAEIS